MLSNRNRDRLINLGRHLQGRRHQHLCASGVCHSLDSLPEGTTAIISCNQNLKTIERGFYLGMSVSMFRNEHNEPNIIVAVGDARYVLDRKIAKTIRVRTV
ncbi:MAG: FeoA family protein [Candidatus Cloacimonetes bacterium]|nr:FeoA family protein [Candidatus Cloacimonadota bacterium]